MKKSILFILCLMTTLSSLIAQVPQAMKYQTVIRNTSGQPMANTNVGLRLSILEDGSAIYQETYDVNTNEFGLVNLNLGEGNSSDNFSSISWLSDDYELQVEVDTEGGTNYQTVGTSSMMTVPFAMRAQTADDVDDADADPNNELQDLTISGNELTISNGNTVTLPAGDAADPLSQAKSWARVSILGTSNTTFDSFNIVSVTKSTTGVYIIQFPVGTFSTAYNPAIVCTVHNDLSPGVAIPTYASGPSQVTVRTYDMSGNLSDRGFNMVAFGN